MLTNQTITQQIIEEERIHEWEQSESYQNILQHTRDTKICNLLDSNIATAMNILSEQGANLPLNKVELPNIRNQYYKGYGKILHNIYDLYYDFFARYVGAIAEKDDAMFRLHSILNIIKSRIDDLTTHIISLYPNYYSTDLNRLKEIENQINHLTMPTIFKLSDESVGEIKKISKEQEKLDYITKLVRDKDLLKSSRTLIYDDSVSYAPKLYLARLKVTIENGEKFTAIETVRINQVTQKLKTTLQLNNNDAVTVNPSFISLGALMSFMPPILTDAEEERLNALHQERKEVLDSIDQKVRNQIGAMLEKQMSTRLLQYEWENRPFTFYDFFTRPDIISPTFLISCLGHCAIAALPAVSNYTRHQMFESFNSTVGRFFNRSNSTASLSCVEVVEDVEDVEQQNQAPSL